MRGNCEETGLEGLVVVREGACEFQISEVAQMWLAEVERGGREGLGSGQVSMSKGGLSLK